MRAVETQGRVRGWAFLPTVLSSIATAAGVLVLIGSFYYDTGGDQVASGVFTGVRWLALGLTIVAAAILAMSLAQFSGRRPLMQGKLAAIVAVVVAVLLVGLLVRTMAI
jgi:predicted anti-sigma-YlaC factor YlaD